MKQLFIALFIIILITLGYFFLKNKEAQRELEIAHIEEQQKLLEAEEQQKLLAELEVEKNYCFLYEQIATEKEPYSVEEGVILSLKGDQVTGVKQGFQTGPNMSNGYAGTLTGTKQGDAIEAVFAYEIEGSSAKEKELYRFSETQLQKFRYALIEEGDMLVPDMSTEPAIVTYSSVSCGE